MEEQSSRVESRVFLVVVDESPEMPNALRYACRRAKRTGSRIALLYVVEPPEPQQWSGISDLMREEGRQQAEATMAQWAEHVMGMTGQRPVLHIRVRDRSVRPVNAAAPARPAERAAARQSCGQRGQPMVRLLLRRSGGQGCQPRNDD